MLFNILLHNPRLETPSLQGKKVLDVFAGTGAVGLEALSRGADSVVFIEKNSEACAVLYENIKRFSLPLSVVLKEDVLLIGQAPFAFDIVFLDPPYSQGLTEKALIRLFQKGWFSKDALVIIESGKEDVFSVPSFLKLCVERGDGPSLFRFCRLIPWASFSP